MTEETEEIESAVTSGEGATTDDGAADTTSTGAGDVDRAAESFLEVEAALATGAASGSVRGRAVDVERVPAAAVPETYPVEIRSEEALALSLDVDDEPAVVYFEFGVDPTDDRLGRLLALKGIPADRFADLHGESVLLGVEDGHHVPVVPGEGPRGSPLGVYGVEAGLGVNLLVFPLAAAGLGGVSTVPVVAVWLLANLVGLPAATYVDAWHCRTHTDWNGGPLFWTALAAVPGVNVLSSAAYLLGRARATPID